MDKNKIKTYEQKQENINKRLFSIGKDIYISLAWASILCEQNETVRFTYWGKLTEFQFYNQQDQAKEKKKPRYKSRKTETKIRLKNHRNVLRWL